MNNCIETTLNMTRQLIARGKNVMILNNQMKSNEIVVSNKIRVIISNNYIRLGKPKDTNINNKLLTKGERNFYRYFSINQYNDAVELILKF